MGALQDIVKKNSPFLRLEDGESVVVKYNGFKQVPSSFDPKKEIIRYLLEVEIDGEKLEKFFDSGNNSLAMEFDKLKEGAKAKLSKKIVKAKSGRDMAQYTVVPLTDSEAEMEEAF